MFLNNTGGESDGGEVGGEGETRLAVSWFIVAEAGKGFMGESMNWFVSFVYVKFSMINKINKCRCGQNRSTVIM